MEPREKSIDRLERRLGYHFKDPALLERALAVRSDGAEVMEFFGDRVLGLLIPTILASRYPGSQQGDLTRMHSAICCNVNLAGMALRLKLHDLLGSRGKSGHRPLEKALADSVEALVGAINQDGGMEAVKRVCARIFAVDIELARFDRPADLLAARFPGASPRLCYRVHVKPRGGGYHVRVTIGRDEILPHGWGITADMAIRNAAAMTLLVKFAGEFPVQAPLTWNIKPEDPHALRLLEAA